MDKVSSKYMDVLIQIFPRPQVLIPIEKIQMK